MPIGLDAKLPLLVDDVYSFYGLNKTVKDNVKQNLKMLLFTAPGERVMLPDYGVGLKNYLFENDPEIYIIEKIREQVNEFLADKITIKKLEVNRTTPAQSLRVGQPPMYTLSVNLVYEINGLNLADALTLQETQIA